MPPEFLSVTPQRFRCYVCGTFTEDPVNWKYRLRLGGHSPVCPSCVGRAEGEIEEMTSHANFPGAVMLGALATVGGGFGWFGLSLLFGDHIGREHAALAIGIGWLVGMAVVYGSGNKRGDGLQLAAGILAFLGVFGGRYLFVNHLVSQVSLTHSGWLTFHQFLAITGRLFRRGSGFGDFAFALMAVGYAVVLPRADRLAGEPPKGVSGWRRWIR